ncbi:ribonuclease HII [Patescibacteria group bacterium]|nr:ribonuclease HII [Patescibacteria group bacterium]MBU2633519.1 ribonuclease HII [Patescibacteria group bacterium]
MPKRKNKYIMVGIDEAGRGPLAGPVAVAAVAATSNKKQVTRNKQSPNLKFKNSKLFKNIKDSKKLSAKQREEWTEIIKNNFECKVAMVGAETIDRIGINRAIKLAIARVLRKILCDITSATAPTISHLVLLDGLLHAPKRYNQKTIIKGDEKIPLISAASIIAKVARDKKMMCFHKNNSEYCFDRHKGYGTKLHYKMIKKNGISPIHRKTYLKKIVAKLK